MGFRGIENPYKTCGKLMIWVSIWGSFGRAEMGGFGLLRSPVATLRDGGGRGMDNQRFSKKNLKRPEPHPKKNEKIRDGGWSGWGP